MFSRLFRKKQHKEIHVSPSAFTYTGDIEGDGVNTLRFELAKRTLRFPKIENAWFARIQYATEQSVRVMLLIDAPQVSSNKRPAIADACAVVIAMDIMFSDSLPEERANHIRQQSRPLYLEQMKLFQCPIIAERGHNTSAPDDWVGAIITVYVADTDHETALMRAASEIANDGYVFAGVHDNRINQIDPEQWWDGHVLETWSEYSGHFPTQDEMECLVRCGGVFIGPALGWNANGTDCT